MPAKKLRLEPNEIKPLSRNRGGCLATDRITVQGEKVGYMYRQHHPDSKFPDSGWTFLAGTESQEYLDDPSNTEIYDVNTIANYDPDIIPFLDAPFGSAFARDPRTGKFSKTEGPPE